MKKIAVIAGMGLLSLTSVHAQQDSTLNRTVVVENQYNPTVMDASKINVLPKVEEPTVPKTHIDYATSIRPVVAWNYQTMSPLVREWKRDAANRGYFLAGYGNNGNVDAQLGYLWDITQKDRLDIAASFGGWNGDVCNPFFVGKDWKSRFYKTAVGLGYKHQFNSVDLIIGGDYISQVFNYLPNQPFSESETSQRQHQTLANVHAGVASTDAAMNIQFMAELGFNYFNQAHLTDGKEIGNENNLYFKGDIWKPFNDHRVGLNFHFNNYSYSMKDMDKATSLEINPYYAYENDAWRIRLEANIDWWSAAESDVDISPNVNVEYIFSDSYVLYANVGGGRENKSFRDLTRMSPYWCQYNFVVPTFVSIDAALGLKASPANGWWFNLTGGYQKRENDLVPGLLTGTSFAYAGFDQGDSKLFYGSAELKYDYKDLFDLAVKATYYNWDWEKLNFLDGGYNVIGVRPELEVNAEMGAKVITGLRIHAGYEYQKRTEDVYDPISNLYLGADYALLKNFSVFGKVNNLLNKDYVRPDAYPVQGLNFLAGLSLKF